MNADPISPEPRVLIVEDEILIAEELTERLSNLGFAVIAAVDTAEEGIAIAIRENPDLVLMDIRLQGRKDGVQAAKEIRQQMDVPIVYVTAYSDPLTVQRTIRDGIRRLHPEAFSHAEHELQSTIDVAMRRHAIRAQQKKQN